MVNKIDATWPCSEFAQYIALSHIRTLWGWGGGVQWDTGWYMKEQYWHLQWLPEGVTVLMNFWSPPKGQIDLWLSHSLIVW